MKRSVMGIIMIVVGGALLVVGIIMVATKSPKEIQPQTELQTNKQSEATIDKRKEIGNSYEDFVVNLLADWRLTLLDRTQDAVSSAGVVAESCKNPDLHVQQKRGNGTIDYYMECKYRSSWEDGKVTFEDWQLDRYRQFQRDNKRKVIIALGVGGTPSAPATFMLVPLDSVNGNSIKQIRTQFVVQPNSTAFVEYMDNYFTTVFDVAKNRKFQNKD